MCGCPVFVGLMTPMTILETRGDSFAALTAGIADSMTVVWLRVSLEPFRRPFGVLWATEIPQCFHSTALRTAVRAPESRSMTAISGLEDHLSYHRTVPTRQHASSGPAPPDVPEPTLAERARTLASLGRIGSLSTHSRKFPGFPFGSMMPYAADGLGRPTLFISSMAMHTQNLQHDARASLLITQPDVSGDPPGAARRTLLGGVTEAPAAEVRDLYLSRYESAKYWQDYTDFAYYRLEVSAVYFIGGFGVMGWVSADDYGKALPDPLAEAAPGIIQHMNADHTD